MSVATMVHIYCDGCGDTYGVDNSAHDKAKTHRRYAKSDGWINIGKLDYCPECVKNAKHKVKNKQQ